MDPYGQYSSSLGMPQPAGTSKMALYAVLAVVVCVSISIAIYIARSRSSQSTTPASNTTSSTLESRSNTSGKASLVAGEEAPVRRDDDDVRLATFAFENYTMKYHVPNMEGRIVRKPPGNAPYKLVPCGIEGTYAVRWQGKFLTVDISTMLVAWMGEKQEPHSCWRVIPGLCGGEEFVMLRSASNNMVLRPDGANGQLVVKDVPTARTAKDYCWKLSSAGPGAEACGCRYDYEKAQVVCTPCGPASTPPTTTMLPSPEVCGPNMYCTPPEKGFDPGASKDADPRLATIARQLAGHDARSAVRYIQQAIPGATVVAVPRGDTRRAYHARTIPGAIAVVYDPATMRVSGIGHASVLFAPTGQTSLS